MNESWKRLIEVERRLAALDTSIYRTNQSLLRSSAAIRNDAMNVPDPFGTGGGGGGGTSSMVRFPTSFTVRVTWTVAPTLKSGASQNVAADGPELAAAAANMVTGFVNDKTNTIVEFLWAYDSAAAKLYQRATYDADQTVGVNSVQQQWAINKFDGGNFAIDYMQVPQTDMDISNLIKTPVDTRFHAWIEWPRRNGAGAIIGYDALMAERTFASTDTFTSGPIYGQSGSWSFAMACAATAYHNAGTGTIYLDW